MMNRELAERAIDLYTHYCSLFNIEPLRMYPCDFPFYAEDVDPIWCESLLEKDYEFLTYLSIALHIHYILASDWEARTLREKIESDLHYEYSVECDCEYSIDFICMCCCDCPYPHYPHEDEGEGEDWQW